MLLYQAALAIMLMLVGQCVLFVSANDRKKSMCYNDCSNNGICADKDCRCFDGYHGVDCSLRVRNVSFCFDYFKIL